MNADELIFRIMATQFSTPDVMCPVLTIEDALRAKLTFGGATATLKAIIEAYETLKASLPLGDNAPAVTVEYTNYKGETRLRNVRILKLAFERSPYHGPEEQYFLHVFDLEKNAVRCFALKDCNFKHGIR